MKRLALSAVLATVLVAGSAHAGVFIPCTPSQFAADFAKDKERARATEENRCKAVNQTQGEWEAVVGRFRTISEEAHATANAGRWDALRALVSKSKPDFERLLKAAQDNPNAYGAADVKGLLSTGLVYQFQNARLQVPLSLDEAFRELERAASTEGQGASAATILANMAGSMVNASMTLGGDIAKAAGVKVVQAAAQVQTAESAEYTARITGTASATSSAAENYLFGLGDRLALLTMVFGWTAAAAGLAVVLVVFKKARLALVVQLPAATLAVAGLVWLVNVVAPFAVPYLAPLALGASLTILGPARAVLGGVLGRPPLVALTSPAVAMGALFAGGIACFIVAFLLPGFLAGILAAFVSVAVLVGLFDARWKGWVSSKAAAPMGVEGLKVSGEALHGSAGWGSAGDASPHLGAAGAEPALALGRLAGVPAGLDARFRFMGHVLTCAPTRAGKGIGAVIPNLLEYPGSALVLDIKGENYAVTARQRRELGHAVYVVDPFGVTGAKSHACNWLDRLDVSSPECVGESAALAECLVIPSGKGESAHFDDTARGLLQGLMLHVASLPDRGRRHLGEVRRLLTADEADFLGTMADMAADPDAAYGVPARAANSLMSTGDRERGSILSTARRSTAFLDDPRIVEALSRSDFDFRQLKRELVTVYIVIPPAKLSQNNRFMRGFIGSALAALTATQAKPRHKVVFFLDEFAQLGRMAAIEDAVSLVSGYGVAFWIFVQDLSQLEGVYPKWRTFLANAAKQFFGTADLQTAKYISESLGKATVEFETAGTSKRILEPMGGSVSGSQHYTGRDLLSPDEVMRLGPKKPIVFISGEPPFMLDRMNYLEDNEYEGKFDANPYH